MSAKITNSIAPAALTSPARAAPPLRRSAAFTVPYSKLFLSPPNVRSKKHRTPEKLRELAAMILADGLLADLQVSAETDGKGHDTGRFGVEAGGNRFFAIGLLIASGHLPQDVPVPAQLVARDRATAVSLGENISQQPMHPADQFAAFRKLIAEGKTIDEVAGNLGIQRIDVERRMRLARVAPSLFELFREDKIELDVLMALASTDDQKRQVAVWKSLPEYQRSAHAVKRRMTEDEIKADDWRVKLIGLDRYKVSGGKMRTDLFSSEEFLTDAGLVELIVSEVLTEAADRLRAEGWAWVEVFETMGYEESQRFSMPPAKYLPESDAAKAKREAMEAELDTLETDYEAVSGESDDEDDERLIKIHAACDRLCAQIRALEAERLDTRGYDKTQLGAVVTSQSGVLKIMRGMMTAKEAKAESGKQAALRHGVTVGAGGSRGTGAAYAGGAAEFSEKLMADLTSHRTVATQAALAHHVPVALAVLADRLYGEAVPQARCNSAAQISVRTCRGSLERDGTRLAESIAAQQLNAQAQHWKEAVPADPEERLSWLLAQPQENVLALIAFCTAMSVDLVQRRGARNAHADLVASALRLDMADWWSVDQDNFLRSVSKAKIAEVVTEAKGAEAAAPMAAMKKAEACAQAAALLAGSRWLPKPMRLGAAAVQTSAADRTAEAATS